MTCLIPVSAVFELVYFPGWRIWITTLHFTVDLTADLNISLHHCIMNAKKSAEISQAHCHRSKITQTGGSI